MITDILTWQKAVEDLYDEPVSHNQPEGWHRLLNDPVFQSEKTHAEAYAFLLTFLQENCFFNKNVWAVFDEVFHFTTDRLTLDEQCADGFLDFVSYYMIHDYPICFDEIVSTRTQLPHFNTFVNLWQDVRNTLDDPSGLAEPLAALSQIGYAYPIIDLAEVLLYEQQGEILKAINLASHIQTKDQIVLNELGCFFARHEDPIRAKACWLKCPDYLEAKFHLAEAEMSHGSRSIAKSILLDILDTEMASDEATALLKEINQPLIEQYTKQISMEQDFEYLNDLRLELGWCYYQNQDYEQVLRLLKQVEPNDEQLYDYHSLYAYTFYKTAQFQEAYNHADIWIELIEQSTYPSHHKQFKDAMMIRADACMGLEDFQQVIDSLNQVLNEMSDTERGNAYLQIATAHLFLGNYREVILNCSAAMAYIADFYPALEMRIRANFIVGRNQLVINDFSECMRLFPQGAKPYIYAMLTFERVLQPQEVLRVAEDAMANHVIFSDQMKLLRARALRFQAKTHEDRILPMEIVQNIEAHLNPATTDLDDPSELLFEKAMLYWAADNYSSAISCIEEAQTQNPEQFRYDITHGDLLYEAHRYRDALDQYMHVQERFADNENWLLRVGKTLYQLHRSDEAISCLEKIIAKRPNFRDTNEVMTDIYTDLYHRTYDSQNLNNALYYAQKDLSFDPSGYHKLNCAYVLMDWARYDEARELLLDVGEDDTSYIHVMMAIGGCYKETGHPQAALSHYFEAFRKAKETDANPNSILSRIVDCYELLKDYDNMIHYAKMREDYMDAESYLDMMANIEYLQGHFEQTLAYFSMHTNPNWFSYFMTGDAYYGLKQLSEAYAYYQKGFTLINDQNRYFVTNEYAFRLLTQFTNHDEEAVKLLLSSTPDQSVEQSHIAKHDQLLARYYSLHHQPSKAKSYAESALRHFLGNSTEIQFMQYHRNEPKNISNVALCYLYMGKWQKAKSLISKMSQTNRCHWCRQMTCYEKHLCMGHLYMDPQHKDAQKASSYYAKAMKECPSDMEAVAYFEVFQDKDI